MARAAAATVTKRTVVVAYLHSTHDTDSNMHDEVGRTLFVVPLKGKSNPKLKMKQQSPFLEVEEYYSSNSSASSSKKVVFPQSKMQ